MGRWTSDWELPSLAFSLSTVESKQVVHARFSAIKQYKLVSAEGGDGLKLGS